MTDRGAEDGSVGRICGSYCLPNSDNGYTVLNLVAGEEEITCVGTLPFLGEGELIQARGHYTEHATYGDQFVIESYEEKQPEDAVAMERYLGSGAIKGVGSVLAARIVRRFGADTFRIIEREPERLAEIKGISERKAREIAGQVEEKKDMREGHDLLAAVRDLHGSGSKDLSEIRDGDLPRDSGKILTAWRTTWREWAFGSRMRSPRRAGIQADSDFRVRSGIFYVLQQASGEGHIYLPREELLSRTSQLLGIVPEDMDDRLRDMAVERKIILRSEGEQVLVYAASSYYLELNTAKMLHDLNVTGEIDREKVMEKIRRIEKKNGTVLDEKQREAVLEAVRCGLTVLTGGPGTGKTTTINTMIAYFQEEGFEIALAAPTGRGGQTDDGGHRLRGQDHPPAFWRCPAARILPALSDGTGENPLEADVIIVDEMSMVDIYLMHALLSAITVGTRLVMVGDVISFPP